MEKRTILAVVLSSAVLLLYYGLFYTPPQAPKTTTQNESSTEKPAPKDPSFTPTQAKADEKPIATKPQPAGIPEKISSMTTPLVKSEISSKSGLAKRWDLESYYEQADRKGPHTNLLLSSDGTFPLQWLLFPDEPPILLNYQLQEKTDSSLIYGTRFRGLQLKQILKWGEKNYTLKIQLEIQNQGSQAQTLRAGLRFFLKQKQGAKKSGFFGGGQAQEKLSPIFRLEESVERERDTDKMGKYLDRTGRVTWAGIEDQYFLRAIVAQSVTDQNKVAYGRVDGDLFTDFLYQKHQLAPGASKTYDFEIYLGPKDPTYLNQFTNSDLESAIDYGWFAFAARPILWALKLFHSFLANWGLAIILLTVVIKILLHPLTKKSMQSMKAMQKLQPELKKIREKFKEDRQRLNMETMSLFKTHKVNPMGGCLPMLLQMPIYIALYKVLYTATELYHAPFFGFYRDLSAPDPYFILPILLGLFMLAQQKLTPSSGDPSQAKLMMIMPVMFTVFMLFLPVGLVLYILVNTVMTVVQQYMNQKDLTFRQLLQGKPS